jgi:hypothetical protein
MGDIFAAGVVRRRRIFDVGMLRPGQVVELGPHEYRFVTVQYGLVHLKRVDGSWYSPARWFVEETAYVRESF